MNPIEVASYIILALIYVAIPMATFESIRKQYLFLSPFTWYDNSLARSKRIYILLKKSDFEHLLEIKDRQFHKDSESKQIAKDAEIATRLGFLEYVNDTTRRSFKFENTTKRKPFVFDQMKPSATQLILNSSLQKHILISTYRLKNHGINAKLNIANSDDFFSIYIWQRVDQMKKLSIGVFQALAIMVVSATVSAVVSTELFKMLTGYKEE